jgi:uncharacterized membrane protein
LASVGAIFFAIYVAVNKVASLGPILAVQGRYFLPILPFFMLVSPYRISSDAIRTAAIAVVLAAAILSNFEVLRAVIFRYYA